MRSHTLIHHFVEQSAADYPDKVAVIHDGVRTTYSAINTRANNLARTLLDRGTQPGDRIAILFDNSLDYIVSYYGSLKTGAIAVPLNTDLKPDSLRSILLELEPRCLIAGSKFERLLQAANLGEFCPFELILSTPKSDWSGTNIHVTALEDLLTDGSSPNPNTTIDPIALGSIIYTSGSTGKPKGVMLSHGNIVSNTHSICEYLHLTPNDIQMVVLPFFYVMGKSLLNTHFAAGGTLVINNKFAFPASVLNEMVSEQVTGFSGVPSTYAYLLHRSPLARFREKLTSLRYCSQAGGHMARAVKEGLRQALPDHTDIYIMYGATEAAARLSYLEPNRYLDKMESIGKAIPGVSLRLLGEDETEVIRGQRGELVATGPNIMQGYWKDPDATAKVLSNGWYRTGDQAYQDADGYFYIAGRKDDLLKVGGHRINPTEIEDELMASGLCVEAVVLGVHDDLLGHRLVAFIEPMMKDCDVGQILVHCASRLEKYKVPGKILQMRSLPKNTSGKIDRKKCLESV